MVSCVATSLVCEMSMLTVFSPEPFPSLLVSLALIVAEIPTFIVIAQQNDQLYSQLGVERYQIVIASLVVMTSIVNQSGESQKMRYSRVAVHITCILTCPTNFQLRTNPFQ